MAYSNNPNLAKARAGALKTLLMEQIPHGVVSRRYGIHRTTLWRWKQKWQAQNHLQLTNLNHPSVAVGRYFKFTASRWFIPTLSSAPKSHPAGISEQIARRVVELRNTLKRCAEIIQAKLLGEGIKISLSSIKRILARNGLLYQHKYRKYRRTIPRPEVKQPGDLVQIDTIHYTNKLAMEKRYIFTVIDLCSRMAYARCFTHLLPSNALATILEAEAYFGFRFSTTQSDNGPEFAKWFSERLHGRGIIHRHTRIHRPNDNAHIERFNRTLRQECIGEHMFESIPANMEHSAASRVKEQLILGDINEKLREYLDFYNHSRLHLGIQCRVPTTLVADFKNGVDHGTLQGADA